MNLKKDASSRMHSSLWASWQTQSTKDEFLKEFLQVAVDIFLEKFSNILGTTA